jgi:hypothetical protein
MAAVDTLKRRAESCNAVMRSSVNRSGVSSPSAVALMRLGETSVWDFRLGRSAVRHEH